MKAGIKLLAALAAVCLLAGCGQGAATESDSGGETEMSSAQAVSSAAASSEEEQVGIPPANGVQVYAVPEGAPASQDFEVTANEMPVGVYSTVVKASYDTTDSFGYFDLLEGSAEITVKPAFDFTSCAVLPESLGIVPSISDGTVRFTAAEPRDFTLVFDGDYHGRVLQIFVSPPETDVPKKGDPGVIYIGPGYHDRSKDPIKLYSGDTLYIAGGAFVDGTTISASGSNITVRGRGVVSVGESIQGTGVGFWTCTDCRLEGIIFNRRSGGWSGQLQNCKNITVERYRVVSPVYYSTDGLNICSSSNITYRNCYFRTADDCVSIKGGTVDKPSTDPVDNILIENCTFWSDGNNAVAVGSETNTPYMHNITVRNSEILYVYDDSDIRGAMAIICLHGTDISNILFENINVGPCGHLTSIFYTVNIFDIPGDLELPGEIHGVTFRNIAQKGQDNLKWIRLTGWSKDKMLRDVTFENVTVAGQRVTEDYPSFQTNNYLENITFK